MGFSISNKNKNLSSMQEKLKWNAIGLVRKTRLLKESIEEEKKHIPAEHTNKLSKLQGLLEELNHLLEQMEKIEKIIIPKLESTFRLQFDTPELIMYALSRPSIRYVFNILNAHFEKDDSVRPLKPEEFAELASSGDAAKVLALIGDAVLDLAIVQVLWDSSLAKVGDLSIKREEIVNNENLARYCDQWGLYSCRLKRFKIVEPEDDSDTIIHEKGTLVEAILGVIYIEFGLEVLLRIVPLLQ
jgi:dsRNA-specific ribonuclease